MVMRSKLVKMLSMGLVVALCAGCGGGAAKKAADNKKKTTDWPKKPIQLICPFSAGGDTDFNARTLAKYLGKKLGVSVVVSNVKGSGGAIAANQVKKSKPDGYTALFIHDAINIIKAANVVDYSFKDFTTGCTVAISQDDYILVKGDSPWNSVQDMIKDAEAHPQKYRFGCAVGSTTHWQAIALNNAAHGAFNIVEVGNGADRVVGMLGGNLDVIANPIGTVKDYVKTGQMKILASCGDKRNKNYPNVPTFKESGVDCSFKMHYSVFFPKGTDPVIVQKFYEAVKDIVTNDKEYAAEINKAYEQDPFCLSPEDTVKYFDNELTDLMKISDQLSGKKK